MVPCGIPRSSRWIFTAAALLAAACSQSSSSPSGSISPGQPSSAAPAGQGSRSSTASTPSQATLAIGAEVNYLTFKLESANTYAAEISFLVDSPLVVLDDQSAPHPVLAAALPSQDNGTWEVHPDGTMRTLWSIRPSATWQDGQPITSSDFAFALRVFTDPGIPVRARTPESYMQRIEPLDDHTFAIDWSQPYPWANQLIIGPLEPLPQHLLAQLYEAGDPQAFLTSSYWSSGEYVGSGPYRLVQWDPGVDLVFDAAP